MCITDMTKLLNDHSTRGTAKHACALAREMIAFEEENLASLKRYL